MVSELDPMASSSSNIVNPLLGQAVSEKLTKSNHVLWNAQVRATIRGARLIGFLTGDAKAPDEKIKSKGADGHEVEVSNPDYENWEATDQQVLNYLLASLSKDILQQVALCTTAAAAWKEIHSMFASQTRARTVNTQLALRTTRKGNLTVAEYFGKMKSLGDEMAATGRPLDDEELTEYIITGLDEDYTPLVSALCARVEPISISELYSQLLNFETRIGLLTDSSQRSVNATGRGSSTRGRGGVRGRNGGRGGFHGGSSRGGFMRGSGRGRGGQNRNFFNSEQEDRPRCQVCFKKNHTTAECWHIFDESYVPDQKLATTASSMYQIDPNWYVDSGATDHITGELEKLTVRNKY
jgi:uncharacterized membrane protein YgcG